MRKKAHRIILVLLMLISLLLPIGCNLVSSVSEKALEVAVIIDNCTEKESFNINQDKASLGSGVIYAQNGDRYSVLTNRHIVQAHRYNCQVYVYDKTTQKDSFKRIRD